MVRRGIDVISRPLLNQTLSPVDSNLVLAEWSIDGTPAGAKPELMAPLHTHYDDDEGWYVLEGVLGVQVGDTVFELEAGDAIVAPRGQQHTFWNPKSVSVRYIIVMTQRIKALIDAIHAAEDHHPLTMKRLFAQYGSELGGHI